MNGAADSGRRAWLIIGGVFFLFLALLGSSGTYQLTQLDYSRSTFLPWLDLSITLALYLLSAVFLWTAWKIRQGEPPMGARSSE